MSSEFEITIEQEVASVRMGKPHVVVLGAGASRATCPAGDRNGRKLPLMADFTEILGLKTLLREWGIDPDRNFEEVFSELYGMGETEKVEQIQLMTNEYFKRLALPDTPTIYDHLVLSLCGKDLIATFNWDPLLLQAYVRNHEAGLSLPRLAFLHGNVMVGYCPRDRTAGVAFGRCSRCGERYEEPPLLYPIKKKDYATDMFIANEWKQLKRDLQKAFMITIFGYSGPKTDQEAIVAMREAWGGKDQRAMEQTSFITIQAEQEVNDNWDAFIYTHHYEMHADFYDSWIANHPRRTGEAYINQYLDAKFISNNPIPRDLALPALREWFERFKGPEDAAGI